MALPNIVQSAQIIDTGTPVSGETLVFTSTPTNGNLLIAFVGYYTPTDTITFPAGWSLYDSVTLNNASLKCFYKVASSETNSYAFGSGNAVVDHWSIVGVEITGQATTLFMNGVAHSSLNATTIPTATVTPSVLGCLALAAIGTDIGGRGTSDTVGSGWTIVQEAQPIYHATDVATRTALTSDTTTAIGTTFTVSGASDTVTMVVLIAPATGGSTINSNFFVLMR